MKRYKRIVLLMSIVTMSIFVSPSANAQSGILDEISALYLNKLIATAKENYPRIKNFNSQVNVAKTDVSVAKVSWLDPFTFQYVGRSNEPNVNQVNLTTADILTGYQFGIAISPSQLLSKPSTVRRAKEQLKLAQYNQEEYNLTIETEVKKRYYTFLQFQKSLVPLNTAYQDSENNFKVVKIAYQKGEVTLQEFNSASIIYNQAYANKLQSEVNYLSAKADLEELTVKKLEEIK